DIGAEAGDLCIGQQLRLDDTFGAAEIGETSEECIESRAFLESKLYIPRDDQRVAFSEDNESIEDLRGLLLFAFVEGHVVPCVSRRCRGQLIPWRLGGKFADQTAKDIYGYLIGRFEVPG